jgi:[NiFe] hydrogenase assembly HybE family chaperone
VSALAAQVQTMEETFRRIERERMQGMPLLNPALHVEAIGFIPWGKGAVGVLLTPWFMNLMLLPGEEDWSALQVGAKVTQDFDSGSYEFTVGDEPDIGRYQMCSLFSPMGQFTDHAAAVETSVEVMRALLDSDNRETLTMHDELVRRSWQGEEENTENTDGPTLSETIDRPISRRELLRGRRGGEQQ